MGRVKTISLPRGCGPPLQGNGCQVSSFVKSTERCYQTLIFQGARPAGMVRFIDIEFPPTIFCVNLCLTSPTA